MRGAEILVKSLEELGVEHVFGYTGAAILPVMDELGKSSIEIVVNANTYDSTEAVELYADIGSWKIVVFDNHARF